jgi:DnaA family protein
MQQMVATFDRLDSASLAEKRRLTIPFIKQVLDW